MRALVTRFDVRVSLLYLLIASLWIVASDTLVALLIPPSPSTYQAVAIFKGLGFVAVTTVALFAITSRELRAQTRLDNDLRKTARLYHLLSDGNQILIRAADEQQLIQSICALLVEQGGYRLSWVGYKESDPARSVRVVAMMGYEKGYLQQLHLTWYDSPGGQGPTGTAIRTGHPSVVRFILTDPNYTFWRAEALQRGYASSIALPIRANDEVLGALNIYAATEDAFDSAETALLVELANDVGYGIQALRSETALRRYAERMAAINRLDRIIASSFDLGQVYDSFVEALQTLVPLDRTAIIRLNEQGDQWQMVCQWTRSEPAFQIGEWMPVKGTQIEWLVEHRAPFLQPEIDGAEARLETPLLKREGLRSRLLLPFLYEGRVIGLLTVGSRQSAAYSDEDQRFLMTLADQLTLAIHSADLYEQVKRHESELETRVAQRTAELERTKEDVEAILNNSSDVIMVTHEDGTISQVNRAFAEQFRVDPDVVREHSLLTLFDPSGADQVLKTVQWVLESGQSRRFEVRARRQDGSTFDADVALSPILEQDSSSGQPLNSGLVCSIRDISERKQAERAVLQSLAFEKELNQLKTRFVSMASHEFRTPLAAVLSATELLLRYRSQMGEEKITLRLNAIAEQVKYLTSIIDDMLNLAHMQSGRADFRPVDLDLDELCRSVLDEFRIQSEIAHRLIYTGTTSPLPVTLDKRLIREVINNLVSNAVKYSPSDKPILIDLKDDAATVVLRVSDQGIGIPLADQRHLFEPFHRAGNVGEAPGTGLGLTITRQAVELHGGSIRCESEEGQGATFVVTLPHKVVVVAPAGDGGVVSSSISPGNPV